MSKLEETNLMIDYMTKLTESGLNVDNTIMLTDIAKSLAMIADKFDQELAEMSNLVLKIKANYLARLKAEKIAMLTELQLEIEETVKEEELIDKNWANGLHYSEKIIQEKINALKEKEFHCEAEESGWHAYNCNNCPNKCEEWYQWDKEMKNNNHIK